MKFFHAETTLLIHRPSFQSLNFGAYFHWSWLFLVNKRPVKNCARIQTLEAWTQRSFSFSFEIETFQKKFVKFRMRFQKRFYLNVYG